MQRSGAITRSAWAERSLAVVALSAALLAATGGAAGVLWLFQDLQDQLWISLAGAAVLFAAAQASVSTLGRRRRRDRWSAERAGFSRGTQLTLAEHTLEAPQRGHTGSAHQNDLIADLLAEVELVQEQLTELVAQVNGEVQSERPRSGGGRHARPVLVDVRTDEDILDSGPLDTSLQDDDDDFDDEPYGVGNVLRLTDRIDLDAAARGRRVLAARDDDEDDDLPHTVVDLSGHGTEDPPVDETDDLADDLADEDDDVQPVEYDAWFDDDLDDGDEDDEGVEAVEPVEAAVADDPERRDRR